MTRLAQNVTTSSGDDLPGLREMIDSRLRVLCPNSLGAASVLAGAVRYALMARGKRLRPILTLLSAAHFGGEAAQQSALDAGCAIELVHTASLILDDLPSMDDATLRRGQPACHRRFGEDVAILAAVGLLNQAFGLIARAEGVDAAVRLQLIDRLSEAVGFDGLVGGQVRDLRDKGALNGEGLYALNHQKTGALFVAAFEVGAMIGGARGEQLEAAVGYAFHLGAAFQILDDLIDATASAARAEKDVRQDRGKLTVVSLLGAEEAMREARRRLEQAVGALDESDLQGPLGRFAASLFEPHCLAA